MEKCPKCNCYTLSYDPRLRMAICTRHSCNYSKVVNDSEDYYNKFVISRDNWDNFCASTPLFVRKLRGTISPD